MLWKQEGNQKEFLHTYATQCTIQIDHFIRRLKYDLGKIFALSESIKKDNQKTEAEYGRQIWGIYQSKIKTAFPMRVFA